MIRGLLAKLPKQAPGVAAAVATASAGTIVASLLPSSLHVSPIPVSIVLGAVAANVAPSSTRALLEPGLKLATSTILRGGIVCVGAKLSVVDVAAVGAAGIPAVVLTVGTGTKRRNATTLEP